MRRDFPNVNRSGDGRMLATGFDISVCESCDGAHLDFKGRDGKVFASAVIAAEAFLEIAAKFCEFDKHISRRRGKQATERQ